jgi:Rieske Fe-S protein
MEPNRREFIKNACGMCASIVGLASIAAVAQSCSSMVTVQTNATSGKIAVPTSHFTAENNMVIIKNQAMEFDLVLVKLANETFKAFELQCTHQANPLVPTKTGFFCNAHGSSFSLDGKVKKEPALKDLREFKVEIESNQIIIIL